MTMSTVPLWSPSTIALCSFALLKRERDAIRTGYLLSLSKKVVKCCCARIVVGTSTATCLLLRTALNAARTAISVLPNPTSPQINRSIGLTLSMSRFTSAVAAAWSGVSSYMNEASISFCQCMSGENETPSSLFRFA